MSDGRAKILKSIEKVLHDLKIIENGGQLDEQTGLLGRGVGLDSVEVLQLVAAIEEEFELTIDDDDLIPEHFRTGGNLVTLIKERYLK